MRSAVASSGRSRSSRTLSRLRLPAWVDTFTAAIPVAAPTAGGSATWKIPVYVIHSDKDEIVSYTDAKKHAEAVKGKGAKVEFKTVSGLSHYKTGQYAPYVGEAVKWLQGEWK